MVSGSKRYAPLARGVLQSRMRLLLGLGLTALACSDTSSLGVSRMGREREAVQSTGLGVFYGLAFAPAPTLPVLSAQHPSATQADNVATLARELAAQAEPLWASAALIVPAVTGAGGPPLYAPAPATNRIRFSCGVTLVSPSFAVTAGHCVTEDDSDLSALKLRLYRPTAALARNYVPALLTGTFPTYTQPKLSAADGYLFDEYACTVVNRCYAGANDDCPDANGGDMALIHCSGRPGDKYGFLNVNRGGNPTGKEALMHWKHEVLDLGGPESSLPDDRITHYVTRTSDVSQNYHYFDDAGDLLPLRSITWSNGTPTTWITPTAVDAHGCHGTSGSGLLVRVGDTPEYELAGLAARSGAAFGSRLCEQVPNPGGPASGPGTQALLSDGMDPNELLALHTSEIQADCRGRTVAERDVDDLPFSAGAHQTASIFDHLLCQIDAFGADGTVAADAVFGAYPEKFVEDASGSAHPIGGFSLEAGADYRAGAAVMPRAACASACGHLTFKVGAQTFDTSPNATASSDVAVTFAAPSAGAANLTLTSSGQLRAFGGIVLIREGQVNSFDTLEDRLEAALYPLDDGGNALAGPLPMRFAGDGKAGFEALLMPGERLALLREALAPGHAWSVRLGSTSYEGLRCGLLDSSGAPLLVTPCAALLRLDDRSGVEARLGFFVELAASSSRPSADLRWVALASDAARDGDSDGVPEVLDNCPGDWNASQGDCSEEPPNDNGSAGTTGESGAGGEAGASSETGGTAGGAAGRVGGAAGVAENAGGSAALAGNGGSSGAATAGTSSLAGASSTNGGTGSADGNTAGGRAGTANAAAGIGGADATAATGGARPRGQDLPNPSDHAGCSCRVGAEKASNYGWIAAWCIASLLAVRGRRRVAHTRRAFLNRN